MNYKVGLRNKVAKCVTLPEAALQVSGIAYKDKVAVFGVLAGYVCPSNAIVILKPQEAPKTTIEVKPQEAQIVQDKPTVS